MQRKEKAIQGYLASCSYADECVGTILKAIDDNNRQNNTIVIITSDHGWHLGEKMSWRKFKPWERSMRVPLLIRVPGVTKPGTVCESPVSLLDIYPTVLDLLDIEIPPGLDGVSLINMLADPSIVNDRTIISVSASGKRFSLRNSKFRFIKEGDRVELYDMENDPNEWTNLSDNSNYHQIIEGFLEEIPKNPAKSLPH